MPNEPCYKNKERVLLKEHLPLSTPFAIILTPSTSCVFKCCYCPQSIPGKPFEKMNMAWDTFTKIVDQIQQFDKPIKAIHFQGMGEPLVNRNLPMMVAYTKKKGIADQLNIITNGALLTEQYSLDLIKSGIDTIKISLQGMTPEKYHQTCGVKTDFNRLVKNIAFLYTHKKDCEVFVKIADISLEEGDADTFFSTFTPISDRANIECIRPMYEGIPYPGEPIKPDAMVNIYAQPHKKFEVCSLGFFMMYINPQGDVYPCCNYRDPAGWGNLHKNTLKEIWNGKPRQEFLGMMLRKERHHQNKYPICNGCNMPDAVLRKEDNLDEL